MYTYMCIYIYNAFYKQIGKKNLKAEQINITLHQNLI